MTIRDEVGLGAVADKAKLGKKKQNEIKSNGIPLYSVTLVSVLSDEEQIAAAKQKVTKIAGVDSDKLHAIGKPSLTKDGLRVEFGVRG